MKETIYHLENHGQIKHIDLPADWSQEQPRSVEGLGTRSLLEFHPLNAADTRLCFFYRGLPMDEQDGHTFSQILKRPPHTLTSSEIASLIEVLRDASNPHWFRMQSAKTVDLNQKRVLLLEGRWIALVHTPDTYMIFIDAGGSGRAVQEIFFEAPPPQYGRLIDEIKKTLATIDWQPPIN